MKRFTEEQLSYYARRALTEEVEATPKPGLVDRIDSGSHKDMNIHTFYRSIDAISGYFGKFYTIGKENIPHDDKLSLLRKTGQKAEEDMFKATEGVNTHKGIIFSLGLISFAIGLLEKEEREYSIEDILNKVEAAAENITEELKVSEPSTYGEKLYAKYGLKGVRGEAQEGFKKALGGLEEYRSAAETLSVNDSLVHMLFYYMSAVEDTNIAGRKSVEDLEYARRCSRKALELGGMKTEEGRKYIDFLGRDFTNRNISPGGSADYLTITYFLYLVNEHK